jgi:predicted cobalt transporter CbtA
MGICEGFLWGVFGGILAEILGLFKIRQQSPAALPAWIKSPFYWIVTALMTLAGGGLVIIYLRSGVDLKAIVAVNLGASAPLLIGTLVAQTPSIEPGKSN